MNKNLKSNRFRRFETKPNLIFFLHMQSAGVTGVSRVIANLAFACSELGHHVEVVVTSLASSELRKACGNVAIKELRQDGLRSCFLPLIRHLRKNKPSVLISGKEHANILASVCVYLASPKTRLIISTHGHLTSRLNYSFNKRDRWLLPKLVRFFYPRASKVVCVSNGVRLDLLSIIGKKSKSPASRIVAIPNPIIRREFKLQMTERPQLLDSYSSSETLEQLPLIVGAGRFSFQKGFDTLLEAFRVLSRSKKCRMLILGDGPLRMELVEKTRALGLSSVVLMPGVVANPLPYFKAADVFVLSSRWEGFGNVVVEALACGTPVVSTDCPSGPAEILEYGKYGRLVPVDNADEIARAITETLRNPPDKSLLISRASEFRADIIAKRYLQ